MTEESKGVGTREDLRPPPGQKEPLAVRSTNNIVTAPAKPAASTEAKVVIQRECAAKLGPVQGVDGAE